MSGCQANNASSEAKSSGISSRLTPRVWAISCTDELRGHTTAATSDHSVMKISIREPGVHSIARMSWVCAVR